MGLDRPDIAAKKDIMKIEPVPDSLPAIEGKLDASGKRFAVAGLGTLFWFAVGDHSFLAG